MITEEELQFDGKRAPNYDDNKELFEAPDYKWLLIFWYLDFLKFLNSLKF